MSHVISVGSYRNFKALTTMQMEMPGMHSLLSKTYLEVWCTLNNDSRCCFFSEQQASKEPEMNIHERDSQPESLGEPATLVIDRLD